MSYYRANINLRSKPKANRANAYESCNQLLKRHSMLGFDWLKLLEIYFKISNRVWSIDLHGLFAFFAEHIHGLISGAMGMDFCTILVNFCHNNNWNSPPKCTEWWLFVWLKQLVLAIRNNETLFLHNHVSLLITIYQLVNILPKLNGFIFLLNISSRLILSTNDLINVIKLILYFCFTAQAFCPFLLNTHTSSRGKRINLSIKWITMCSL